MEVPVQYSFQEVSNTDGICWLEKGGLAADGRGHGGRAAKAL